MTQDKDQMRAEFEETFGPPPNGVTWFRELGAYLATRYGVSTEGYSDKWVGWQAARASAPQGVPEGWQLVPVEATREMIDAMSRVEETGYWAMYEAALAAASAPQGVPQAVPEGWQLVPKRPTQNMCEAAKFHVDGRLSVFKWADGYYAMLAESPTYIEPKETK